MPPLRPGTRNGFQAGTGLTSRGDDPFVFSQHRGTGDVALRLLPRARPNRRKKSRVHYFLHHAYTDDSDEEDKDRPGHKENVIAPLGLDRGDGIELRLQLLHFGGSDPARCASLPHQIVTTDTTLAHPRVKRRGLTPRAASPSPSPPKSRKQRNARWPVNGGALRSP
jgi:hypothetical protein